MNPNRILASAADLQRSDDDSVPEDDRAYARAQDKARADTQAAVNKIKQMAVSKSAEPPVQYGNLLPKFVDQVNRVLMPAKVIRDIGERELGEHIVALLNSRLEGGKIVIGMTSEGQIQGVFMERKVRDRFRIDFDSKYLDPRRVISPMVTTDMVSLTFRPVVSNEPRERDRGERVLIIVTILSVPRGKIFKAEGEAFHRSKKTKRTERMDMNDVQKLIASES